MGGGILGGILGSGRGTSMVTTCPVCQTPYRTQACPRCAQNIAFKIDPASTCLLCMGFKPANSVGSLCAKCLRNKEEQLAKIQAVQVAQKLYVKENQERFESGLKEIAIRQRSNIARIIADNPEVFEPVLPGPATSISSFPQFGSIPLNVDMVTKTYNLTKPAKPEDMFPGPSGNGPYKKQTVMTTVKLEEPEMVVFERKFEFDDE